MAPTFKIDGTVANGFEKVEKYFIKLFEQGREDCSQFCVYKGQEKIIDLWGSADGDQSYGPDSLQMLFSSTKTVTAISIACMVDRGLLEYNEKVSKYWSEFAQNGKENVKVVDVLRHEAGLAHIHHTWENDAFYPENIKKNIVGRVFEEEKQWFPPENLGTNREYHSVTRGFLLNEIFRRVEPKGRTIGEFIRDEVCGPLEADVKIGLSKEEVPILKKLAVPSMGDVMLHSIIPKTISHRIEVNMWNMASATMTLIKLSKQRENEPKRVKLLEESSDGFEPTKIGDAMETEAMKHGEFPSMNGAASARGLARLGACMVNMGTLDGVKIISEETVVKMVAEPEDKFDAQFGSITSMTQGGVGLFNKSEQDSSMMGKMKSNREGFLGWMGLGGSVFMWHPELKLSVAYVPSRLAWYDFANSKAGELTDVVVKCARALDMS